MWEPGSALAPGQYVHIGARTYRYAGVVGIVSLDSSVPQLQEVVNRRKCSLTSPNARWLLSKTGQLSTWERVNYVKVRDKVTFRVNGKLSRVSCKLGILASSRGSQPTSSIFHVGRLKNLCRHWQQTLI